MGVLDASTRTILQMARGLTVHGQIPEDDEDADACEDKEERVLRVRVRANAARLIEELLLPMLGLTQLSNYLSLKGSFSAVSKPNFVRKYALELGSNRIY